MKRLFALVLLIPVALGACRKKDLPSSGPDPSNGETSKGSVQIELNNVVNGVPLETGVTKNYIIGGGDTLYSVITYNYYISNIVFVDDSGRRYAEPESYHLAIASSPATLNFSVSNVPVARYTSMEFLIGVDSVHNFSGAQSGDLDPKYGMIWDWNTGYIMAKLEGKAASSTMAGNNVSYHIAGYKAPYSTVRKVVLPLTAGAVVTDKHTPAIHIQSDLNKWFDNFSFKVFATTPSIGSTGASAAAVADKYKDMFSVTAIEN